MPPIDPKTGRFLRLDPVDRFWTLVQKTEACWLWTGSLFQNIGYGQSQSHSKRGPFVGVSSAHRMSWIIAYGKIPKGLHVCHHCDNRQCVRPDHLFVGTAKDNMRDCVNKHRRPYGERHHKAKLTEFKARYIKSLPYPQPRGNIQKLAERFNVSTGAIQDIFARRSWKRIS